MTRRHLDLFSGIGGFALAAKWAGFETVAFCEIDPYCQKVLRKNFGAGIVIHDDITKFDGSEYAGTIDLLTGGFPCQPYSIAGQRRGDNDDRALWREMLRVIENVKPAWIVGENVANFVNMALDPMLAEMESRGYEAIPFVIPAAGVGAPHNRARVFVIAHTTRGSTTNKPKRIDRRPLERTVACSGSRTDGGDSAKRVPIIRRIAASGTTDVTDASGAGLSRTRDAGCIPPAPRSGTSTGFERGNSLPWHIPDPDGEPMGWATVTRYQRGQWATEPDLGRVADGIPSRVDRLKGLGNAVVPQQVYPILEAIAYLDRA